MIALLVIGIALLGYTLWNWRNEEADPLLFSEYLSGHFEITRMEHPFIYWAIITIQLIVALGSIGFGIMTLI